MENKPKSKSLTLADVAKHAGVSMTTASRVINKDQNVKASTREKVEASIAQLKYSPNVAARNLAGARAARVCLLYGNPSSAYLGELLMGALEAAGELGVRLIVERTDEAVAPRTLAKKLHKDWDGLIVPPPISDIAGFRKFVAAEQFPTVFISSATTPGRAHEIRIDDFEASREVVQSLIDRGHKRIGFIKGHPNQTASEKRYNGYCQALKDNNIAVEDALVEQGFFTYRSGLDSASVLIDVDNRPTAIFASNDDMAAGVIGAAARYGLSVPRDLSVVGFDDSPIATTVWPHLTTVCQPVADMAARAVRLVQTLVSGKASIPMETIVVPFEIIERDSVAVPRT